MSGSPRVDADMKGIRASMNLWRLHSTLMLVLRAQIYSLKLEVRYSSNAGTSIDSIII